MSVFDNKRFGLSAEQIAAIHNVFRRHPKINRAILYGSRAKGNFRPGSDIDLTLQGEQLLLSDLLRISNELDDLLLPYTIDLSIYHTIEEPALVAHIARVGIEFFCKPTENASEFHPL